MPYNEAEVHFPFGDESGKTLALRQISFPPTDRDEIYLMVGWHDLEAVAANIVTQIKSKHGRGQIPYLDGLIGIANGGLPLAVLLARALDLNQKVMSIGISGYDENNNPIPKTVQYGISENVDLKGKAVGVVDEICDEGDTFVIGLPKIQERNPKQMITIAAFRRTTSKFVPDISGVEIPVLHWLQFEHDWVESRRNFWSHWQKHNFPYDEVINRFAFAFQTSYEHERGVAEQMGIVPEGNGFKLPAKIPTK